MRMLASVARLRRIVYGSFDKFVGHQRDVGRLERRVAAHRAHHDADIGGGQRGRVVHAVADHRDRAVAPRRDSTADDLVRRQLPRSHVVDAELRSGGARRGVVIAGDHRDARDALRAKIRDDAGGIRLWADRVTPSTPMASPLRATTTGDMPSRTTSLRECRKRGVICAALGEQSRRAADDRARPATRPSTPSPGSARTSAGDLDAQRLAAARVGHDCGGDRMFGLRFHRRRPA